MEKSSKLLPYARHLITRSWLWTADFMEEFLCLSNILSVVLTALQYKPQWKNGAKYIQTAAYYIMAHVRYLIRHNVIGMFLIIVTKPFKTRLSIYYVYNFRNSWLKLFFISLFSLPFRPKWFSVLFIHRNILLGISEEFLKKVKWISKPS